MVLGGESKTLAWGFAMAPHRLRALVLVVFVIKENMPFNPFKTNGISHNV